MRIRIGMAFLLLAAASLFYTSYRSNKLMLQVTDDRPGPRFPVAVEMASLVQGNAERYQQALGRWPDSLEDLELDVPWMLAHRGIEKIRIGEAGAMRIDLKPTPDAATVALVWIPGLHGERIQWECVSDTDEAQAFIPGCGRARAGELEIGDAPERQADADILVPGLDSRCQLLGRVAYAAAQARANGDTYDVFIRRPLVLFQNDEAVRRELEAASRWIFDSKQRSPGATQRETLNQYRCLRT